MNRTAVACKRIAPKILFTVSFFVTVESMESRSPPAMEAQGIASHQKTPGIALMEKIRKMTSK